MTYKIVIADDEPITRLDIREIVEEAGYEVVGEASDGFDAVELCRKCRPDLVLMDIKMPLLDGIKATKMIHEEGIAGGVLLLTAYSGKDYVEQATAVGVMGYVVKPVNEKALLPMIEVTIAKGKEIMRMKDDVREVKDQLDNRKVIERAKGVLMQKDKISEEEAYSRIRKLSMNKRCSMKKIAEIILINE